MRTQTVRRFEFNDGDIRRLIAKEIFTQAGIEVDPDKVRRVASPIRPDGIAHYTFTEELSRDKF